MTVLSTTKLEAAGLTQVTFSSPSGTPMAIATRRLNVDTGQWASFVHSCIREPLGGLPLQEASILVEAIQAAIAEARTLEASIPNPPVA